MTPHVARNALTFLERATVAGKEVPAYIEAVAAINAFANPQPDEPRVIDGDEAETT